MVDTPFLTSLRVCDLRFGNEQFVSLFVYLMVGLYWLKFRFIYLFEFAEIVE